MCKITKISLVIFLFFFLFNLIAIFNSIGYLKQNESSIHQSELLNIGGVCKNYESSEKLVKFSYYYCCYYYINRMRWISIVIV
jgi:hypothetical protein